MGRKLFYILAVSSFRHLCWTVRLRYSVCPAPISISQVHPSSSRSTLHPAPSCEPDHRHTRTDHRHSQHRTHRPQSTLHPVNIGIYRIAIGDRHQLDPVSGVQFNSHITIANWTTSTKCVMVVTAQWEGTTTVRDATTIYVYETQPQGSRCFGSCGKSCVCDKPWVASLGLGRA